ncbi:hypothetical protein B0H15DRAFT_835475 [Mycena belliarum]|uniref:MYND-type domain-containing protein n=1 Tax=Mycena belliarum TaxID=1033014 RepID=A0AAD6UA30_9AGAR|nr:hypothetical protein B0H15DRAFT_835475 [Mycena belliae]
MNLTKTPPHDAFIGQACLACFNRTPTLSKCAGCGLANYCSRECQKKDWKYPDLGLFTNDHKRFCHAVKEMDRQARLPPGPFPPKPTTTMVLDERIDDEQMERRRLCLRLMGANFISFVERSLLSFEPRCLACGVAPRHIKKAAEQGIATTLALVPCKDCKMTYFCSDSHRELSREAHTVAPVYGGHDELSQCALNQEMRAHLWCEDVLNRTPGGWNYRPLIIHPAWKSIIRTNWRNEFMASVIEPSPEAAVHGAEPLLRVHTESLSPVMSSIYAFELLHKGSPWTKRKTLTIHILACGAHDHVVYRFEEMMHRLPELQELEVHYFGYPEGGLSRRAGSDPTRDAAESPAGTLCATCKAAGKVLTLKVDPLSSEYAKWLGKQKTKPDLLMAHSLERLVMLQVAPLAKSRGIATFFTSPFREMAEAHYSTLAKDYTTLPDVPCARNPWGSLRTEPARDRITGVHSKYGWMLAGYWPRDV